MVLVDLAVINRHSEERHEGLVDEWRHLKVLLCLYEQHAIGRDDRHRLCSDEGSRMNGEAKLRLPSLVPGPPIKVEWVKRPDILGFGQQSLPLQQPVRFP